MDDGDPLKGPICFIQTSTQLSSFVVLLGSIIELHVLYDKVLLVYWFHIICEIKLNKAECVVIVIFGCDNTSDNNTNMHAELGVLAKCNNLWFGYNMDVQLRMKSMFWNGY